ncbi:MAG: peptide-methionine (R)-S-oxide reductase, partial [Delftia acidovorans]|nr:peptide-methionine (R)-S-oxide reductase [Delftia acidovorans]
MTTRRHLLWTAGAGTTAVLAASLFPRSAPAAASSEIFEVSYSDAEWRARLTPEQYQILRKEGTERAGTSPLNKEHRAGTFACAGCALPLFSSKTKFDSGTGWPSF